MGLKVERLCRIGFVSATSIKGRVRDENGLGVVFISVPEMLKLLNQDCVTHCTNPTLPKD